MRKWGVILICFIIILVTLYIYRYHKKPSFEGRIPKSTQSIIAIDLRKIEHHFLMDFLVHPFEVHETKNDSIYSDIDIKSIINNINIPSDLLLFSKNESGIGDWVSESVSLKNTMAFKSVLTKWGFKYLNNVYSKGDFYVKISNNKFQLAWASSGCQEELFLTSTKVFIDKDDALFEKLTNNTSDLCFAGPKSYLGAFFLNGCIKIEGQSDFDFLKTFNYVADTTNIMNLKMAVSTKFDLVNSKFRSSFNEVFRKINISGDSLIHQVKSVDFLISDFDVDIDTIKSYVYDNDFNKKEIITTQNIIQPNFYLKCESNDVFNYLKSINAIQNIEGINVLASFPLIKTYVEIEQNSTYFYSKKNQDKRHETPTLKEDKFYFNLNLEKYRDKTKGTIYYNFEKLKNIQKLMLRVAKNNKIQGEIKLSTKRNAVLSILDH